MLKNIEERLYNIEKNNKVLKKIVQKCVSILFL
jgi:hypothetical protein